MQTTAKNEKGRRAGNTTTPMQTADDFAGCERHQQCLIDSPRHRRALQALLAAPQSREDIDRITGASNGPDEVMRIRRQYELTIPCPREDGVDMDGHAVQVGVYHLTSADKIKVKRLLGIAQ